MGLGNAVYVTGVGESLGAWHNVYRMVPTVDEIGKQQWTFKGRMPRGVEFKLLRNKWINYDVVDIHAGGFEWEDGPNHVAKNVDSDVNVVLPVFGGSSTAFVE